jgi:hypothetical protein
LVEHPLFLLDEPAGLTLKWPGVFRAQNPTNSLKWVRVGVRRASGLPQSSADCRPSLRRPSAVTAGENCGNSTL